MKRIRLPRVRMYAKIMLLCTFSIVAALLMQAFLYGRSSETIIYNQTKATDARLLQSLKSDVNDKVRQMQDNLIAVYNQNDLIADLQNHADYARMQQRDFRAAYTLAQQFSADDRVVAVYLYDDFNRIVSVYRHASTPVYHYPDDLLEKMEETNGRRLRTYMTEEDTTMLVSSYYNVSRGESMVRFALNIFSQNGSRNQIGCVVCDVDSAVFAEILDKYILEESNVLWLQPVGDRAAVSAGSTESQQDTFDAVTAAVQAGRQGTDLQASLNGQVLFELPIEPYGLTLYSLMPATLLIENQKELTKNLLLIAAVLFVVFAVVAIAFAGGITRPLNELTRTMRRIEGGETKLRVKDLGGDEIGELGRNFNTMLDRIELLLTQEYKNKLLLQKAQYNALQAQINPHFLYNTLDTMSSIAQIQHCSTVSELSESLSGVFRYTLKMDDPYATVEQELIHLKNYIFVMDVRLHNEVDFVFDVQNETLPCRIPRLTLQPIVENALQHGIRTIRHEKQVTVQIRRTDMLTIEVKDNGVGMDAAQLNEELRRNDLNNAEKGHSIGLHNINARIKLLYGKTYGVQVESEPGHGTAVRVTLPITQEEKQNGTDAL